MSWAFFDLHLHTRVVSAFFSFFPTFVLFSSNKWIAIILRRQGWKIVSFFKTDSFQSIMVYKLYEQMLKCKHANLIFSIQNDI